MLNARLAILDIADTEAFCNAYLDKINRRHPLGSHYESALAYLISETWRASLKYDPTRTSSFERYARAKLPHFLVQWYRSTFRDSRYDTHTRTGRERDTLEQQQRRSVQQPSTLDETIEPDYGNGEHAITIAVHQYPAAEPEQHELGFLIRALTSDPTADGPPTLARILTNRNSQRPQDQARFAAFATQPTSNRDA